MIFLDLFRSFRICFWSLYVFMSLSFSFICLHAFPEQQPNVQAWQKAEEDASAALAAEIEARSATLWGVSNHFFG